MRKIKNDFVEEVPAPYPVDDEAFVRTKTPHRDKLIAALENPKAGTDEAVLLDALDAYYHWIGAMTCLNSAGKKRVEEMVDLLNAYKDHLEIDLIMTRGSEFLNRQKGQMKIDNSVLEEFFIHIVRDDIIENLPNANDYLIGPQRSFMSLAFIPGSFKSMLKRPDVAIKSKDQDFVIGANINYSFSSGVIDNETEEQVGNFAVAALAAECKVNLDKTMFQEAAGTAARLKQGCPFTQYYVITEFLDMTPEDVRLTSIDNVYFIRKAKRLPPKKRRNLVEVRKYRRNNPICAEIVWQFVQKIESVVNAIWYDPKKILERGSFA